MECSEPDKLMESTGALEGIWISHQALDYESGGVIDFVMGFFCMSGAFQPPHMSIVF